jgi:hypothetical protein
VKVGSKSRFLARVDSNNTPRTGLPACFFAFSTLRQFSSIIITSELTTLQLPNSRWQFVSHRISSESFQQMMARLRTRDQNLDDRLAHLGEELHEYARDHRNFIAAVDAGQITASVPQHPVAGALNTFGSAQVLAGAAPDSDTDIQMAGDDETVLRPDDAPVDDEPELARPTTRRRVTFAESDVTIAGMASPQASEIEQQEHVAESVEVEMPSDDTHIPYNRPEASGMPDTSIHTSQPSDILIPFLDIVCPPVLPANKPTPNPQDFIGHFGPPIHAGGLIKPLQQGEYEDLSARAEEVNTHYVCAYPGCGNMYTSSGSVERHLRRDHADWAVIKDQVMGPNSKWDGRGGEALCDEELTDSL